jgi:hypothetical protein
MVELYFPYRVTRQFSYKQHILIDIDTSDALHAIHHQGKNVDCDWLSYHKAYVSYWDAQRNEISIEMHHVITIEKYLIWYMSIIFWAITANLKQVPPPGYMQYEQHA